MAASVGWVDRPELSILDHCLKHSGIQQLRLLDDALDHLAAGLLQLRLNKAEHCDVALDFDVLPQIQAVRRHAELFQPNLRDFGCLNTRLVAGNAILVSKVNTHGCVDMSLEAPRHIMEAAIELDSRGPHLPNPGHDLDALRDFIPGRVVLVRFRILWRGNGLVSDDERV